MTISYATARSAPILEWADERRLIEGWQNQKDRFALEKLLLSHVRIVFAWVRKLSADKAEQEEMVSEGILGLIKAADMFDLAKEVRFSTYARWWVKNSVLSAFERLRSIVEMPAGVRVEAGQQVKQSTDVFEMLVCDDPTPEERMIANSSRDLMRARLAEALKELGEVDRDVVTSRALKQPSETFDDLAARLKMNSTKLRQIERRAMSRLKNELLARGVTTSRAV
ncbi:sigma-70 family RNA polymerase sigma factor [Sulfitobacter sp. M57]|uniref:sigma-70 family RNA polymerase sigma factor n=1 Tax=unclassified Sulfitobacter TaxID=196795 RepID=UPI0023E15CB2|nr:MULTISPECIES: sigma-70 family RNA polymerase sigma factor [unclassified Sulfitobacter]MDF3414802.1 sigma-70 family RNA polymerase sigma factor [Sulfitobacter sp. KE5]MDF3422283.1 sigma-70 family RNA polymerase sigma factor [Sulfitobacter sp. KE43]MDF3433348.1 sigma-70 family RNA polymerase sigma factor [Sulfitobacter sp. KE42]MDF3458988.1 sigma-70 family RNA polymerase sigma factor [Sulfitobacter sp. S74]MDF3462887.1 sigma-70 family RNA polymerase sigma factor [Sulfitobacter sp. Ks18]